MEPGVGKPIGPAGDRQWLEAVLSGRSVCEGHDPTGELSAGDPHAQFGGQGVETDLWEPD